MHEVLRYYLRHGQTLQALEDLMKLMNSVPGAKYQFPDTKYKIIKEFSKDLEVFYFVECSYCDRYTRSDGKHSAEINCYKCKKSIKAKEINYFIYISLEEQLKNEVKRHWLSITKYFQARNYNDGNIRDVYDAEIFKRATTSTPFTLPLMINTDGMNVFNSNQYTAWPILLIQNYLPPSIRYNKDNIMVISLYYGKKKPTMANYFLPLAQELDKIDKYKIVLTLEDKEITFTPIILSCCLDLPAKASVQQINQYNGYNACTYCIHPGKLVSNSNANKSKVIRYVNTNELHATRTHEQTIRSMYNINTNKSSIGDDGVKGLSCMVAFQKYDIINGFAIDYMHCVLLGVMKSLLDFWLDSKNSKKDYYIKLVDKFELNSRIVSIKPCMFISRRPRSLEEKKQFKASELKNMLLYYLPVCLIGILPKKYLDHFMLLSSSIYILLGTKISSQQLNEVEDSLNKFTACFELYYGKENMVMNVHLLKHLVQSVKNLGPLWTQSAFPFESYNGVLLKYVNGTTDVLLQMCSKYILKKAFLSKEQFLEKPIENNIKLLGKSVTISLEHERIDLMTLRNSNVDLKNVTTFNVFKKIKKDQVTYTSLLYTQSTTTADYFIKLSNGSFGIVKYYFVSQGDGTLAMLQRFVQIQRIDQIIKVIPTEESIIVSTNCIVDKFLYMNIHSNHYIVSEPNPFERQN